MKRIRMLIVHLLNESMTMFIYRYIYVESKSIAVFILLERDRRVSLGSWNQIKSKVLI